MTLKVLVKLDGAWGKPLTLETFRTFNQMEKEYWKILKKKLLKVASSKMESLMGEDAIKTRSWTLSSTVILKTVFFTASDSMKTRIV